MTKVLTIGCLHLGHENMAKRRGFISAEHYFSLLKHKWNGVDDIENFGFKHDRPFAITIWLSIITDNLCHLICNYLALKYL